MEEASMVTHLKTLFGKEEERGFTLIELLIVILIVGILAAVATPLYLGYVKDAKTAEAKTVAGALWTAVQSNAIASCGTPSLVSNGYPKAGLDSGGASSDGRWSVSGGANSLTVTCASGAYSASPNGTALFTIAGVPTDVDFVRVALVYTLGGQPPAQLQCSTDGTTPTVPC
jgi:type IV pilus assembly protein PilA